MATGTETNPPVAITTLRPVACDICCLAIRTLFISPLIKRNRLTGRRAKPCAGNFTKSNPPAERICESIGRSLQKKLIAESGESSAIRSAIAMPG